MERPFVFGGSFLSEICNAPIDPLGAVHTPLVSCGCARQPEHLSPHRCVVQRPVTQHMPLCVAQSMVGRSVGVPVDELIGPGLRKPEQGHGRVSIGKAHALVLL